MNNEKEREATEFEVSCLMEWVGRNENLIDPQAADVIRKVARDWFAYSHGVLR